MATHTTAEIIAIGSELLLGGRLDTNSLMLTDALAAVGIEVRYKSVVGDERADIVRALRVARQRVSLVLMTGGLGPTLDDCTREAVALVTTRPLRPHAEAVKQLTTWLRARGRAPSEKQMVQALIPRGGSVLRNPVGSAPGFLVPWSKVTLVALPGVPAEAQQMFQQSVLPRLRPPSRGGIVRRTLLTYGLPESEVEERIVDLVPTDPAIALGTLASPLGVTVSLTYSGMRSVDRGRPRRSAHSSPLDAIERSLAAMRARLGSLVYGEGTDNMEEIVGRLLVARGLTLATAESCTGGLIGHRVTQVPGSSAYYYGGAVCYSNQAKLRWVGVDQSLIERHGAVSAEVAAAMALGIKQRSGCAIGVSATGIAGPGGATEAKPVGLVYVGLAFGDRPATAKEFRFHGLRDTIKLRASQAALNWLRLALMESESGA